MAAKLVVDMVYLIHDPLWSRYLVVFDATDSQKMINISQAYMSWKVAAEKIKHWGFTLVWVRDVHTDIPAGTIASGSRVRMSNM